MSLIQKLKSLIGMLMLLIFITAASGFAVVDIPPDLPGNLRQQGSAPGSGRDQHPRPTPPPAARESCNGKKEGDACSFNTPQGVLHGVCLSGRENIFACRPHRGSASTATVPEKGPEEKQAPSDSIHAESKPAPVTSRPDTPPRPIVSQPAEQVRPQEEKSVEQPVSTSTAIPESPLVLPNKSGSIISYLLIALGTAGLTWYGFHRYAVVPLRRLRKVTQQLAKGDLSARVGEGLLYHKGEVADLGRDVDRMAERTESLVGAHQRLIRDVSHELRSPLARLNVALELARQTAGPALSAPFDRIDRESDRLNELISQLLMLTRLENESGMLQRTDLDMAALIAEIAQDVDFEVKSMDRQVIAQPAVPLILNGNRELLRQALENLVRNAARYTAAGTAVEISLHTRDSGGRSWAHIEVRDQGPGVPESELYDIFRPFYRVNDARERQSGGTGVGLAISDRAIRLHGGSLRAFNAVGGGLIMEVELPFT